MSECVIANDRSYRQLDLDFVGHMPNFKGSLNKLLRFRICIKDGYSNS